MNQTNRQEYFIIGCKLLGAYCLIQSIPIILHAIAMVTSYAGYPDELSRSMTIAKFMAISTAIIYVYAGFYLLKFGNNLYKIVYSETNYRTETIENFLLFLKMLGVFILISDTRNFIQVISDLLFKYAGPSHLNFFDTFTNAKTNFLPSLVGIAIGLYLVIKGDIFIKIGFKNKEELP